MATYAVVCAADAEATARAVAEGTAGGWIAGGDGGTAVLFDAPETDAPGLSIDDVLPPARALAKRLDTPVAVLVGTPQVAYAVFLRPGANGGQTLAWAADWEPPTDPAEYAEHRKDWDEHAAVCAEWFGRPEAATALAEVRNDPRPGRPKPGTDDLLRHLCEVLGLPVSAVGVSSLTSEDGVAEEGLPSGSVRVEGTPAGSGKAVPKSSTLRALRALVLLAGFYLLGFVLIGALVGIDALVASWGVGGLTGKVIFVSVILAIPIVRGMFMLRTPKDDGPSGIAVTEAEQPELWSTVRALADRYGTRAPDEIVLVGEVNAAVSEEARLLGLVGGRRRMYIGVPLLAGLSERQLHAVLTHELGHYGNSDTRLSAITLRGQRRVVRTIEHFEERAQRKEGKERARQEKRAARALEKGRKAKDVDTTGAGITYRAMAAVYTAYAKLYFRASHSVGRGQEIAADLAAVKIAGRDATASALREIPVLDAAFDHFMRQYATFGAPAGLLPPAGEVYGGLRRFLADPVRQEELAKLRARLPREQQSPYDSHPPIAERVRTIEALPADEPGTSSGTDRPALELLHDLDGVLVRLEQATLTGEALALNRVEWSALAGPAVRLRLEENALPLRTALITAGAEPTVEGLLDAADAGKLLEGVEPEGVAALAGLALTEPGVGHWELTWDQGVRLVLADGGEDNDREDDQALSAAVEALLADTPDTAPLREILAKA